MTLPNSTLLPRITTEAELVAVRKDTALCNRALRAVAERNGLSADVQLFADGSAIVGAAGETVIKIFSPADVAHANTESRALEYVGGKLPCATPGFVGRTKLDDWPAVLMTRLHGRSLASVWDALEPRERRSLCAAMGKVAAALHALPIDAVHDLPPSWPAFMEGGLTRCLARQRSFDLDASWLDQIEPFLDSVELPQTEIALLHTELALEHFMVDETTNGWELTGLLDFEPAMVGNPEYELASVALFITRGDASLLGAFLEGYSGGGYDSEFPRRCLAYALLHRYACLPRYLKVMPTQGLTTLDEIAARWWAT